MVESGGGGFPSVLFWGSSAFSPVVCGRTIIKIISSTSSTSIMGVTFISHASPRRLPGIIAIVRLQTIKFFGFARARCNQLTLEETGKFRIAGITWRTSYSLPGMDISASQDVARQSHKKAAWEQTL